MNCEMAGIRASIGAWLHTIAEATMTWRQRSGICASAIDPEDPATASKALDRVLIRTGQSFTRVALRTPAITPRMRVYTNILPGNWPGFFESPTAAVVASIIAFSIAGKVSKVA